MEGMALILILPGYWMGIAHDMQYHSMYERNHEPYSLYVVYLYIYIYTYLLYSISL